jgi:glucose 1-dehydrogenase
MKYMRKVAIVTGSEGDIGKAIVKKLKSLGIIVYGFDIKNGNDITNYEDIYNKIEIIGKKYKHIDILINNAGINKGTLDDMLEINLIAPKMLNDYVSLYMYKNGGSIINITSIRAELASEDNPFYGMSKGGLKILSKCEARDLAQYNIRVNNVGFGYIKTDMTEKSWNDKKRRKVISDRTLLGRWGKPEDVVGIIAFLCTDEASYITGQSIYVDGGLLAKCL